MSIYRHISEAKKAKEHSISRQCELLGVSVSGYWAWARRAPSDRALYDAWLIERIKAIHKASKGRYGSPRVHAMLAREGVRVGEKRVARLMRTAGLEGAYRRRKKGCTTGVPGVEPFGISSAVSSGLTRPTGCGARMDRSQHVPTGAVCAFSRRTRQLEPSGERRS